ncbi:MAG: YcaO-like family protein, partial [Pseudomonadota bacterium]
MKAETRNKYKECPPEETVERIKKILKGIGIELEDHWGDTGMEGFYTLRVNIPGTGIGSNGKGASREYAQASAYAEFMERLQNDYMGLGDYDEDTWRYMGFYHTPDEKLMDPAELAGSENAFVNMLSAHAARVEDRASMMTLWQLPVFPDWGDAF